MVSVLGARQLPFVQKTIGGEKALGIVWNPSTCLTHHNRNLSVTSLSVKDLTLGPHFCLISPQSPVLYWSSSNFSHRTCASLCLDQIHSYSSSQGHFFGDFPDSQIYLRTFLQSFRAGFHLTATRGYFAHTSPSPPQICTLRAESMNDWLLDVSPMSRMVPGMR